MTRDQDLRVVLYDPGAFIPYYVDGLSRGLAALGVRPRVISSPPLFAAVDPEGEYDVDWHFFPFLRGAARALVRRRRVIRQGIKVISYPAGIARTLHALRRGPPGIFHLQWAPIPLLDIPLVRALKRRAWRTIYTVHDPLPSPDRPRQRRKHIVLLRLADALLVHSRRQRDEIASADPALASRVHVIAHGATRFPLPTPAERVQCREVLRVDTDRQLLLFFGQIKPHKGLEYLLAAMPQVVARFPRTLLLIAGEPLMSLSRIERLIAEQGLRDHVSLRPGFVPDAETPRYLRAADLLVAPYVRIATSGVVVLAQGHGLPIVATNVGGLPEFIEHERSGLIVPPRDSPALAAAIGRALDNRDALAAMGRRAWERLENENRWCDVAARTLSVYSS